MTREGVDFSRGGFPGSAALKAAGKSFVVRYVVGDLSPMGRGITAAEYAEYVAGGIDVAVVWEGAENRITAGFAAGKTDARDAQAHLVQAGMPTRMPIYFACDFDAGVDDMAAIDDYVHGCAAVLGNERVGIYGGYSVMAHCATVSSARWFWQTSAWEYGRGLHPAAHLYQYEYNVWVVGVNCDACRALVDNFGQAAKFIAEPFPQADLPPWWADQLASADPHDDSYNGAHWMVARRSVVALANTYRYTKPDIKSPKSGPPIKTRDKVAIERVFDLQTTDAKGKKKTVQWLVTRDGDYIFGGRFSPRLQIHHR